MLIFNPSLRVRRVAATPWCLGADGRNIGDASESRKRSFQTASVLPLLGAVLAHSSGGVRTRGRTDKEALGSPRSRSRCRRLHLERRPPNKRFSRGAAGMTHSWRTKPKRNQKQVFLGWISKPTRKHTFTIKAEELETRECKRKK